MTNEERIKLLEIEVEFLRKDRDASVKGERVRCIELAQSYGFHHLANAMRDSGERA